MTTGRWVRGAQVWHVMVEADETPLGGAQDGVTVFDNIRTACGLRMYSGDPGRPAGWGDVWEGPYPPPADANPCHSCLR